MRSASSEQTSRLPTLRAWRDVWAGCRVRADLEAAATSVGGIHIGLRLKQLGVVASFAALTACAASTVPPMPPRRLTFEQRCADPAVVKCVGFDTPAEVDPFVYPPHGATEKRGRVVTDVKASGAGALRFDVPFTTAADTSGAYWQNFSDDLSVQFGEGQEFFVQGRQRFSPAFLGRGWKQAIIGEGDRPGVTVYSCTQLEIVTQNTDQRGFAQLYHSCGRKDGRYEPLDNVRAIPYRPNQWMTFQVQVKIGRWYQNDRRYRRDSTVRLWVAEEGRPSKLAVNQTGYDLANENPAARYGKVWLLPYGSFRKVPSQREPIAYTWYDELLVSRSRIADPA
jgi:hypothetical protein